MWLKVLYGYVITPTSPVSIVQTPPLAAPTKIIDIVQNNSQLRCRKESTLSKYCDVQYIKGQYLLHFLDNMLQEMDQRTVHLDSDCCRVFFGCHFASLIRVLEQGMAWPQPE